TPYLNLDNVHISWMPPDETSGIPIPQAELSFNYPVDPSDVQSKLHIEVDGKAIGYTIRTLSASNVITLRLSDIKAEDRDYDLRLLLDKGMLPEGGMNGTPEPAELKTVVPSPFVLSINDVTAEHDGLTGTIMVK